MAVEDDQILLLGEETGEALLAGKTSEKVGEIDSTDDSLTKVVKLTNIKQVTRKILPLANYLGFFLDKVLVRTKPKSRKRVGKFLILYNEVCNKLN
ncbi:hypothetical protein TNIN_493471 [Trichonephila inaurata madagascariensis]|uniref:Uncharacterized protein n=1 Tax=Trichonephila inaurata madagascariensis TaxID=2747483 RepID=A0A8X6XEN3_9ARAC|nr:hypothetical protein TNIN_493471 [Trichonephila inaurata madagascariensis]